MAVAVDRFTDGDWQDPDVLAALAVGAVRFSVGAGQNVAVSLRPTTTR